MRRWNILWQNAHGVISLGQKASDAPTALRVVIGIHQCGLLRFIFLPLMQLISLGGSRLRKIAFPMAILAAALHRCQNPPW
jgi:hypothetical protein